MYKSKNKTKSAFEYSFTLIILFWVILAIDYFLPVHLGTYGILPRTGKGLIGIITAPFIHGSLQHLIANTFPFLILSWLFFYFYNKKAWNYFITLWLSSGLLTWIIGREAYHVGASGIIYALASFLFFGGIVSRNIKLLLVAIIVATGYSGLIFGLFPTTGNISWEGHFAGALSGLICAYIFRKQLRKFK